MIINFLKNSNKEILILKEDLKLNAKIQKIT